MPRPAPTQFSGIFISYRRDDSAGHAGRLFDRLSARFGADQVFMDIDHIEPGEDFVQVIEEAVGSCEILLTVIGRRWLLSPGGTSSRMENPNDFVRLEIAAALQRNIRVIPVLVEGAAMPLPQDLPEELSHFTRRQAIELSDQRWGHDVNRLLTTLEKVFADRRAEHKRRQASAAASPPSKTRAGGRRAWLAAAVFALVAVVVAVVWRAVGERNASRGDPPQPSATASPARTPDAKASPTTFAPAAPSAPEGMVYVPGGEFKMGRDGGDVYERPAHSEKVEAFFMDTYEVTCGAYESFVREAGRAAPKGWQDGACPAGAARKPVTGVNWDDADSFCRARGKRLPTEAEWEFAARGTDGRRYPWGDVWRAGLANADGASGGVVDVGNYPEGKSPFGVLDMVGNAWEWTADDLRPYQKGNRVGRLPGEPADGMKVIRGCMYGCNKARATATYRRGWPASGDYDYGNTGFRCAKDAGN